MYHPCRHLKTPWCEQSSGDSVQDNSFNSKSSAYLSMTCARCLYKAGWVCSVSVFSFKHISDLTFKIVLTVRKKTISGVLLRVDCHFHNFLGSSYMRACWSTQTVNEDILKAGENGNAARIWLCTCLTLTYFTVSAIGSVYQNGIQG